MKVLVVCSGTSGRVNPFISDQVDALKKKGVEVSYFLIERKGIPGYLRSFIPLRRSIKKISPDILHAHYGLSGLLSNLQRRVPVVTTFHGSDINVKRNRFFSRLAYKLSAKTIFVSPDLKKKLNVKAGEVIPCGVDLSLFKEYQKDEAREGLNLDLKKKYILFSSSFDRAVKNYPLAKKSVELLNDSEIELLEFKGYTREESALLHSAVDVALMTSFTEGSPQFIKEAMANNKPIVSVNVGDVGWLLDETKNSFIVDHNELEIAKALEKAIALVGNNTRNRLIELKLSADTIADNLISLYKFIK